jgi:glycosyltransferase involved in cell wall biosynthesis
MTATIKVLSVIPAVAARNGGPVINLVESIPHLAEVGVELSIATTDAAQPASSDVFKRLTPDDLPAGAREADLSIFRTRRPYKLGFAPGMYRSLGDRVGSYDVVRIHGVYLFSHFAGSRRAEQAGVPYIVSPHGALDPYLRQKGRARKLVTEIAWQRRMLARAAALHAMTDEERRLIADLAPGVPRQVVPNGLDIRQFGQRADGERFRAERLAGHSGRVVLFLGRISRKKGIDVLIRAMAEVVRERPDTRLVAVGPDDEELTPELEALAASLGIADSVTFTGPLFGRERAEALAGADLWALSSHTENFGIAAVEAMASGVPVVISPGVNIAPEAAAAGAAVVAELEPHAFAAAIGGLLDSPEQRRRLAAAAASFVRRYDWSAIAPRMRAMFEDAMRAR